MSHADLSSLSRESGALAMLAIDQRESMRAMFAAAQAEPVSDAKLTEFKLAALRALTPYASAALLDREFAWDAALAAGAVAPSCGLIAAADHFVSDATDIVADVSIDPLVEPRTVKSQGAAAMKLLVIWRPDEDPADRIAMVQTFVERCQEAELISIIEPISRKPRDGRACDVAQGIIEAARELGALGADLYKAEVPLHGAGGEAAVRAQCAELTRIIDGPWVVLSSGVEPDAFPQAVEWACKEGARGFLAGRAIWKQTIGSSDVRASLREDAVPRLKRLVDVVDRFANV